MVAVAMTRIFSYPKKQLAKCDSSVSLHEIISGNFVFSSLAVRG